MNVISEQIKKYRIANGLTQEQLGQLVGVTTQAVSKWERGGMPDAELLPNLAETLNVSIDTLFGRQEQSITMSLARQISRMSNEEAYKYAFNVCWTMGMGLMQELSMPEMFLDDFVENTAKYDLKTEYFSKIMQDGGMVTSRISSDFHHFFLLVEPKNSLKNKLSDLDSLSNVFKIFADKKILNIIFYMYSRLNTPIATSLISKNTGMDMKDVDHCMKILCENNLATCNVVATADGDIYTYMFNQESAVIPFLCFADEISRKDYRDIGWSFERTKPLF